MNRHSHFWAKFGLMAVVCGAAVAFQMARWHDTMKAQIAEINQQLDKDLKEQTKRWQKEAEQFNKTLAPTPIECKPMDHLDLRPAPTTEVKLPSATEVDDKIPVEPEDDPVVVAPATP